MKISTLTAALKDSPDFVAAHLGTLASFDKQAFTAFNTAFAQHGPQAVLLLQVGWVPLVKLVGES